MTAVWTTEVLPTSCCPSFRPPLLLCSIQPSNPPICWSVCSSICPSLRAGAGLCYPLNGLTSTWRRTDTVPSSLWTLSERVFHQPAAMCVCFHQWLSHVSWLHRPLCVFIGWRGSWSDNTMTKRKSTTSCLLLRNKQRLFCVLWKWAVQHVLYRICNKQRC